MQGGPATNGAHDLHAGAFAVGTLHINDFVPLAHAQVDWLLCQLVQLAHGNQGCITHVQTCLDQIAELQQAHAQAVAARLRPIHITPRDQVIQDAVGGRGVQARFLADFLQGNGFLARGQHINQGEHAFNHLHRGGVGRVEVFFGHSRSVVRC